MDEELLVRPPGPHPSPEELYLARHRPEDPASLAVRAHVLLCARCSEEELRQEAFDSPAPMPAGELERQWQHFRSGGGAAPRTSSRRWAPYLAMAATVAGVALGLTLLLRPDNQAPAPDPDVLRGGAEVATPWSPSGTLAERPSEFYFPAAGGRGAQVMLFDATRKVTWTSEPTDGDRVAFPPPETLQLVPGVEYYWMVLGSRDEAARRFVVGR